MRKRLLFSLFALCLLSCFLLSSCGGSGRFSLSADGYTLTDGKGKRQYAVLSPAFEPARGGEEVGTYEAAGGQEVTLRVIPGLDATHWLADDERNVYCAGETPEPATWMLTAALFCEEDAVSMERFRLTDSENAAALALLRTLYFEGAAATLPPTAARTVRRVKLISAELPSVYFCFDYYRYEDGSAYFYERFSGRAVAISAENDAILGVI